MDVDGGFEPLDHLLDMALEFAANTWTDAAYYVLLAAHAIACAEQHHHQVINTARFLAMNDYFRERLACAETQYQVEDFRHLADRLARELREQQVSRNALCGRTVPMGLPTEPRAPVSDTDLAARIAYEQRAMRAWREARAYRSYRTRTDS